MDQGAGAEVLKMPSRYSGNYFSNTFYWIPFPWNLMEGAKGVQLANWVLKVEEKDMDQYSEIKMKPTALITGGSRGIGLGIAKSMLKADIALRINE